MKALLYSDLAFYIKTKLFVGYILLSHILHLIINDPKGIIINMILISLVPASSIQIEIFSGYFRTLFTFPITKIDYVNSKFLLALICNFIAFFLISSFIITNYFRTGVYDWSYYNLMLPNILLTCFSIFLCLTISSTVYVTIILNLIVILPLLIRVIVGELNTFLILLGKIFFIFDSKSCLFILSLLYVIVCYFIYIITIYFFKKKEINSFK